jgi:hypothetical protein
MVYKSILQPKLLPEINVPLVIQDLCNFFTRFMILHAPKGIIIAIWLAVIRGPTAIHLLYLLLLVLSLFFQRGPDAFGTILMLYSQGIILAKMCYNFPEVAQYRDDSTYPWIGLEVGKDLWYITKDNIAIIVLIIITRLSSRWDDGKVTCPLVLE